MEKIQISARRTARQGRPTGHGQSGAHPPVADGGSRGHGAAENENHLLPLQKASRVALFGKASADYVKGGGGSGDVTVAYVRNLCDGMEEKENAGMLSVFAPLNEFYRENVAQQHKAGKIPAIRQSRRCPPSF